jgi:hypothetical protein
MVFIRGQIRVIITNVFLFFIFPPFIIYADWIGPKEIVTGEWGKNEKQFYYFSGESEEYFPRAFGVNTKNGIFISDEYNKRIQIFNSSGKLKKTILPPKEFSKLNSWPYEINVHPNGYFVVGSEGYRLFYDVNGEFIKSEKVVGEAYIVENGYLFRYKLKEYVLYSFLGQLLKTYDSRPLELGILNEVSIGNGRFESTLEFPDYKYKVNSTVPKYVRDIFKNLYVNQYYAKRFEGEDSDVICYRVIRVDRCTGEEYVFEPPKSKYEPLTDEEKNKPAWHPKLGIEYGEPIISPLGDLYCWARTKTHYKILKWTWQGPENAPQSLQITAGVAGLKLNWQKPVKDADTVTGYQILRSAEVCGPFNEVVTVKKDKLAFEDRTIKPPWKYYYVVKAVRDKKFSGDSNKVYMQWK